MCNLNNKVLFIAQLDKDVYWRKGGLVPFSLSTRTCSSWPKSTAVYYNILKKYINTNKNHLINFIFSCHTTWPLSKKPSVDSAGAWAFGAFGAFAQQKGTIARSTHP